MSPAAYQARAAKFASRKRVNHVATGLAMAAMSFGLPALPNSLPTALRRAPNGLCGFSSSRPGWSFTG